MSLISFYVRTGNGGTNPDVWLNDAGTTILQGTTFMDMFQPPYNFLPDQLGQTDDLRTAILNGTVEWSRDGINRVTDEPYDYDTAHIMQTENNWIDFSAAGQVKVRNHGSIQSVINENYTNKNTGTIVLNNASTTDGYLQFHDGYLWRLVAAPKNPALGDLMYFNGNRWVRLAAGTTGNVLQTNGASAPTWVSLSKTAGAAVGSTSSPTTTSGTFATLSEMTVTLTTTGGPVMVSFNGTFSLQSGDDFDISIFVDGSEQAASRRRQQMTGASGLLGLLPGSMGGAPGTTEAWVTGLSAGSHTFTLRWRANAGTGRAYLTQRQLICREMF